MAPLKTFTCTVKGNKASTPRHFLLAWRLLVKDGGAEGGGWFIAPDEGAAGVVRGCQACTVQVRLTGEDEGLMRAVIGWLVCVRMVRGNEGLVRAVTG